MLIKPTYPRLYRNKWPGVAQHNCPNGTFLRRIGQPVQSHPTTQGNWRQVFGSSKRAWLSMGPLGANRAPINGLDPQTIWANYAALYFGIVYPGIIVNNVQSQSLLGNCANPEAFFTMVQNLVAAANLPPLPVPAYSAIQASNTNNPDTVTNSAGSLTAGVTFPSPAGFLTGEGSLSLSYQSPNFTTPSTTVNSNDPQIQAAATWQTPSPAVIDSNVAGTTQQSGQTRVFNCLDTPSGVTTADELYYTPTSPSGPAVGPCTITAISGDQITVTIPVGASCPTGAYGIVVVNPALSGPASGTLTVTVDPATPLGTYTVTLTTTDDSNTWTNTLTIAVTTGPSNPVTPPPSFPIPTKLAAHTVLDATLQVQDFVLTYTTYQQDAPQFTRNGVACQMNWIITASAAYTDSYSPPAQDQWLVVTYNGVCVFNGGNGTDRFNPSPTSVLAAWKAVYGDLPTKGSIKFMVQPWDPATGCPGPAVSCTASWEEGTFKGSQAAAWDGDTWVIGIALASSTMPTIQSGGSTYYEPPGTATFTITVQPSINTANDIWPTGYTFPRTFKLTLVSDTAIPNGACNKKKTLPPGGAVTISPSSLTFASGSSAAQTATATLTLDSDTPSINLVLIAETTDGVYTQTQNITINLSNATVQTDPFNFLAFQYSNYQPGLQAGVPCTIPFQLQNSGPDDIPVSLYITVQTEVMGNAEQLAINPFVAAFDNDAPTVPAGTIETPGVYNGVLTLTEPANIDTADVQIALVASAAKNTTTANIFFGPAFANNLSIAGSPNPVTIPAPGSAQVTVTVSNTAASATTVTLSYKTIQPDGGITLSYAQTTLTVPAASGNTPGTASTTATITVPSGAGVFEVQIWLIATASNGMTESILQRIS
jgi:hypothetical protein